VGFALRMRIGVREVLKSFAFLGYGSVTGVSFLRWSSEYCMIGAVRFEWKKLVDLQSRKPMSELYYYFVLGGTEWNRKSVGWCIGRILPEIHYLMDHHNTFDRGTRDKNIMILVFWCYVQVCKPAVWFYHEI
jgi:hypothetical protein